MNFLGHDLSGYVGAVMLLAAGGAMYAAARAGAEALSGGAEAPNADTRRAVGSWIPVAVVVLIATLLGRVDISIAVIFAVSVACLSLVPGLAALFQPDGSSDAPPDEPRSRRRAWGFVLAVGLMLLLIGFSGRFTLLHAGLLFAQGLTLFVLFGSRQPVAPVSRVAMPRLVRALQLFLAVGVSMVGAYVATRGMEVVTRKTPFFSFATLSAIALAPLLTLPMIGMATELARRGRPDISVGSGVTVTMLNLCLLLPLVIVTHTMMQRAGMTQVTFSSVRPAATVVNDDVNLTTTRQASTFPTTQAVAIDEPDFQPTSLSFPLALWRIDTVLLVVFGFVLLPVSTGRWSLGRLEGSVLVIVYAGYVMAVAGFGPRWQ